MRRLPLVLVLLAGGLTACRGVSVATQNLDVVLSSTDNFRYQGVTTDRWKDMAEAVLSTLRAVTSASSQPETPSAIPDPTEFALENLMALAASREGADDWRDNEQVRVFTRFAVYAPSQLCRERALTMLEPHAHRLSVSGPYVRPAELATAAELIEAVDGLLDGLRAVAAAPEDATARADLEAALEIVEALELDVQGGARLLRSLGPFLRHRTLPADLRERAAALSLEILGPMVREALWSGVRDRSAFVRAAGMRVSIAVLGDAFRVEAVLSLSPRAGLSPWILQEYGGFGLPDQPVEGSAVHVAVADDYVVHGLPLAARRETVEGLELRVAVVYALLRVADSEGVYPIKARHAVMGALSELTDGEVSSLRPEIWEDWWVEAGNALMEQAQALEEAGGSE